MWTMSADFFSVTIQWFFLLNSLIIQILSYQQNERGDFTFSFQDPFDVFK